MIEVLKQAFTDAKRNERHNNVAETRYWLNQYKLIAEQAIAELESQEPVAITDDDGVAWAYGTKGGKLPANKVLYDKPYDVFEHLGYCPECEASPDNPQPHPPQRTWVGLTDEEIASVANNNHPLNGIRSYARAIEAKLKELNG